MVNVSLIHSITEQWRMEKDCPFMLDAYIKPCNNLELRIVKIEDEKSVTVKGGINLIDLCFNGDQVGIIYNALDKLWEELCDM